MTARIGHFIKVGLDGRARSEFVCVYRLPADEANQTLWFVLGECAFLFA